MILPLLLLFLTFLNVLFDAKYIWNNNKGRAKTLLHMKEFQDLPIAIKD